MFKRRTLKTNCPIIFVSVHVKINVFNHTFQVKMLIFLLRFYICYQLESFTGKFPSLVNLIFDFQNIKEVMFVTSSIVIVGTLSKCTYIWWKFKACTIWTPRNYNEDTHVSLWNWFQSDFWPLQYSSIQVLAITSNSWYQISGRS